MDHAFPSLDGDRRAFLRRAGRCVAGAALASLASPESVGGAGQGTRPRVAAIVTEFRLRSHAHVLLENFLEPYLFNGRWTPPGADVVSLYVDQFPPGDMARDVARSYGIPIFPSIGEALRLGGRDLAVDAVLSIGEHGNYPVNAKGQVEYPRKRFFDEIVSVFEASGRVAPVFNDKHLSYRWDWAEEMFETARRLDIPLMAGSSVPLAARRPPLELPAGATIREAVSIHGGNLEGYDFHGLEVLQSMIEARRGGETGISRVRFLAGDELWKAADEGLWSIELADAAMAAELGPGRPGLRRLVETPEFRAEPPHGLLLDYRDGLRAVVLKVGVDSIRWNFACRLDGEAGPRATRFDVGPWRNRNLFRALAHAIQVHFRDRRSPYPVERTLLATGVLDAGMESRIRGGEPLDTPHLAISYPTVDFRPLREMGESWTIITADTPEPPGIDTAGRGRAQAPR